VGCAEHVASTDTEVKRKISVRAMNQNLALRCSVDNPVCTVTMLTQSHKLCRLTLSMWWANRNRF